MAKRFTNWCTSQMHKHVSALDQTRNALPPVATLPAPLLTHAPHGAKTSTISCAERTCGACATIGQHRSAQTCKRYTNMRRGPGGLNLHLRANLHAFRPLRVAPAHERPRPQHLHAVLSLNRESRHHLVRRMDVRCMRNNNWPTPLFAKVSKSL